MKSTAALRRPVDADTAPRTIMNCPGPARFRLPIDARVAAAPPLRPGSQEIAAPAAVPRNALRASPHDRRRRLSMRCAGIRPEALRRLMKSVGSPKRPEKRGNTPAGDHTVRG